MAERVAEIEQRAVALLGLVTRHHGGLRHAGVAYRRAQSGSKREHAAPVLFQPAEEFGVVDQPVLGDLRIAGAELARIERRQDPGIGQHQRGLIEGADEILAVRRIDRRLAAD